MATEGFVQLASDGTGKEVRTVIVTGAGPGEHQQVVTLADSAGNLDPTLKVDLSATSANATAVKVDGSGVTQPISGTFWQATQPVSAASLPLPTGAAADATLTGGTVKAVNRGGAKGSTSAADVTSTASGANHQTLDVSIYDASGNLKDPTAIRALTSADVVTAAQGTAASASGAWTAKITDGTNTAAVKAASAAAAAADPSVVVALSPNSPVPAGTNVIGHVIVDSGTVTTVSTVTAVTAITNALPTGSNVIGGIAGDVASAAADSGKPVKIGGKATLNGAALPTAVTASQRVDAMTDEYGRYRILINRPALKGLYYFESGRLTVQASAHGATVGFFWLINPVGSTVLVVLKKLIVSSSPTAVTAFASAPRITAERVTFTGTASGAQITPAKRDSNDAAATATLRTASTGLTLTAGAIIGDYTVPAVLTAVGIAVPIDQILYEAKGDEDDLLVLRAGEGLVLRQPDAGTASDTRLLTATGGWEER